MEHILFGSAPCWQLLLAQQVVVHVGACCQH
jgi:hypothetical protein